MDDQNIGPKRYGDYTLLKRIAEGGMGDIYLAQLDGVGGFRRDVVVKQLKSSLSADETFTGMLLDEARIASRLNHPNIVQVINCGMNDGLVYLVLEYVYGQSLRNLLNALARSGETLTLGECICIGMDVLAALNYAHTRVDDEDGPMRIIHRDVTPENVLLSYSGDVKLTDFGVASATGRAQKTQVGTIKGKIAYLAPEQLRDTVRDHRIDQYSAALSIAETVLVQRVFDGESESDVIRLVFAGGHDHVWNNAVWMEKLGPLGPIIVKALSLEPDGRYASCGEMAAAMATLLSPAELAEGRNRLGTRLQQIFAVERTQERIEISRLRALAGQLAGPTPGGNQLSSVRTLPNVGQGEVPAPVQKSGRAVWSAVAAVAVTLIVGVIVWLSFPESSKTSGAPNVTSVTSSMPVAAPASAPVAKLETRPAGQPAASDTPPEAKLTTPAPARHSEPAGGTVDFACVPWCDLYVNRQSLHKTGPLRNYRLAPGEYEVKAVYPPTGQSDVRHIIVHSREHTQVQFKLAGASAE